MKKWVIYLLFLLVFISSVSAQYYYSSRGFSFGNFNLMDFYFAHPYEIDFFIFLLIFLGLSKSVFKSRFKEGGNILYIGISIALALALVYWEYNTRKFLLGYSSIGITILVLLVIFVIGWAFFKFFLKAIFPGK